MVNPTEVESKSRNHPQLDGMIEFFEAMSDSPNLIEKHDYELSYEIGLILRDLDPEIFVVGVANGFFQAVRRVPKGELATPEAGLKIHICMKPETPHYLEAVTAIKSTCSGELTGQGIPTTFKIITPSMQRASMLSPDPYVRNQSLKWVTIYPRYRIGDGGVVDTTNVPETLRIISILEQKLNQYKEDTPREAIEGELRVADGIFIRPGPFTEKGVNLASSDQTLGFEGQLSRLAVNQDAFREELAKAGIYER